MAGLFSGACCGQKSFNEDFRKLMKRMFPDSELKPLPPQHPVWTATKNAVPPNVFKLEGIQQGCKTVVIYSPQPMAGYWEGNQFKEGRGRAAFTWPAM